MVALLGYGKTTRAAAREIGAVEFFADIPKAYQDDDDFWVRPTEDYEPAKFTLAIPSPGLPPSHPLVRRSPRVLSDYDYFFDRFPYSIWISGTNGKTTTTQMITHLLAPKGAISGGNIGTPVAALDTQAPIWVLESSSFTLHYTNIAKPNLYVLLPITPDHLSWHGDFAAYEGAKLKPVKSLKEGEVAIVPKKYLSTPTKGHLIGYDTPDDLADSLGIDLGRVPFAGPFLLDAALALGVQKILFGHCNYERMAAFSVDPHKQQEFRDKKGRLWVDDSKATNIDAALQAVMRYRGRPIHLILGGDNKGVSLAPLIERLPQNTRIYAIGTAAAHIEEAAKAAGQDVERCDTLDRAVAAIDKRLGSEGVALLSPACASLDQFASYKERGERFQKLVLSLM
jgi:UDP-N-acetylmuramoylalanine--D-glutamate ligase